MSADTSSFPAYDAAGFLTSGDLADVKGRGSFSCVRKCEHSQLGTVVVKCFNITGSAQKHKDVMKEVERETNALCCIDHNNIIRTFGTTRWANNCGIILEYLDGGNLEDLLMSKTVADIPWLLRLRMFYEIADGLCYLHHYDQRKQFVHGDLKPQNILLTSDLVIKIADFGSVNIVLRTNATQTVKEKICTTQHTPFYASPEVLNDPRIKRKPSMDVYSFGMIGYEILARYAVFKNCRNINVVLQTIIDRGQKPDLAPLLQVESALEDKPQDLRIFKFLKKIIFKCLEFDAQKRPDMDEVRNQTRQELQALDAMNLSYHIDNLRSQGECETSQEREKITLNQLHYPFEEGPGPSSLCEDEKNEIATTNTTLLNQRHQEKTFMPSGNEENDQAKFQKSVIKQLEEFSNKDEWNEVDKLQLLSLWVQVHEFQNRSLTKRAALCFPKILDLSKISLNEQQTVSMSEVMKNTTEDIDGINLSNCQLQDLLFGHFSAALLESKYRVGKLWLNWNKLNLEKVIQIIPKVKDGLFLGGAISDGSGGSRDMNQDERNRLQRAANEPDNSCAIYLQGSSFDH